MKTGRLNLLDTIRGITLVSMILYHGAWDLVYLAGIDWPWYHSRGAFCWQQSICWTFILLSGYCIPLSVHRWKRALTVFGAGLLVTAVTVLLLPEERVVFGVLTFLGSAMLLMALTAKYLEKLPDAVCMAACFVLFLALRHINEGYLTLMPGHIAVLPQSLYRGLFMTWLGFTQRGFYSTDYFSMLPWIFLFLTGFYGALLCRRRGLWEKPFMHAGIAPFAWMGRHSLMIYLLHQPVLYVIVLLISYIR